MTTAYELEQIAYDMHLFTSTKAAWNGRFLILPDGRKTDDTETALRWYADAKTEDAEEQHEQLLAETE